MDSVVIGIIGRQDGPKGHRDLILSFNNLIKHIRIYMLF